MRLKLVKIAAVAGAMTLALTGCSSSSDDAKTTEPAPEETAILEIDPELSVFGAASLTEVLPEIDEDILQVDYPGMELTFNFGGSSGLVDQLRGGAPADVLFTADEKNMNNALADGLVTDPQPFTANTMVLIVPAGNPGNITGFETEALDGSRLVVCAPEVPCGNATVQLSEINGVTIAPVSEEQSVNDVLAKVVNGEADAGLVYKTDAMRAGADVEIIEIPNADQVVNLYMVAITTNAANPEGAQAFIDAVLSEAGQKALQDAGFAPIPEND
ncbi:MAG: molybdate ABC transporter substrate-binding protein [Actinomycetaceae bacterium]|nr:molybdate ABC transporter substrate-binding protein [Actinomycetaceae bacterium]